jgi:hypothetical protein
VKKGPLRPNPRQEATDEVHAALRAAKHLLRDTSDHMASQIEVLERHEVWDANFALTEARLQVQLAQVSLARARTLLCPIIGDRDRDIDESVEDEDEDI